MVINGQGRPVLLLCDSDNPPSDPLRRVELPYCQKLTENYQELSIAHEVTDGVIDTSEGWRYSATLDYAKFLDGAVLLQLKDFLRLAELSGSYIVLMPRKDAPELSYRVRFKKGFSMSLIPNVGHEGIVFEFEAVYNLMSVPTIGFGFGTHFGGKNPDGTNSAGFGYEL